jgi:hypothetical protein
MWDSFFKAISFCAYNRVTTNAAHPSTLHQEMPMSLTHPTIDDLSPARQRLVAIMRDLRYGQIRDLRVVDGEPVFEPAPRLIRAVQLCGGSSLLHRASPGHRIKSHILELLDEFDALGTGLVDTIKVQDGLPVHVQVAIEDLATT